MAISRRLFVAALPVFLASCTSTRSRRPVVVEDRRNSEFQHLYRALPSEPHPIPTLDVSQIDRELLRQEVPYSTSERPGTIIVEPYNRFLYLVQPGGSAMRYGVGVGREGYTFRGTATVGRKAAWPRWTPTQNMIRENPELNLPFAGGVDGGITNPLGARALYLYRNGRDTMYRLHGTNEPRSIGQSVSSGCIRLFNHDIIDLYDRTRTGARVIVRQA